MISWIPCQDKPTFLGTLKMPHFFGLFNCNNTYTYIHNKYTHSSITKRTRLMIGRPALRRSTACFTLFGQWILQQSHLSPTPIHPSLWFDFLDFLDLLTWLESGYYYYYYYFFFLPLPSSGPASPANSILLQFCTYLLSLIPSLSLR